jgi:hypothetical protein
MAGFTAALLIILTAGPLLSSQVGLWASQAPTVAVEALPAMLMDIRHARLKAMVEGNRYHIDVSDEQHYRIHDDDNSNGAQDPGERVVVKPLGESSMELVPNRFVTFGSSGRATAHGSFLAMDPEHRHEIVVEPSGEIRMRRTDRAITTSL